MDNTKPSNLTNRPVHVSRPIKLQEEFLVTAGVLGKTPPADIGLGFDVDAWSHVMITIHPSNPVFPAFQPGWEITLKVWKYREAASHGSRSPAGQWFLVEENPWVVPLDGTGRMERHFYVGDATRIFIQPYDWEGAPVGGEVAIGAYGLARQGELVCDADPFSGTVNVNEDPRPEPDERVLHDGDEIAGPDPLDYPATVYFPDVNGIDIRDGVDDERRNVALYLEILAAPSNHADSEVTVTVEEDIAGLGDWVNMSAAGYSIINDVRGVTEWTNVTATDDPLEDRVDWDGVRGHRVRVRVDTGSIADEARLVISLSEEN
jgi:hypothetical protein